MDELEFLRGHRPLSVAPVDEVKGRARMALMHVIEAETSPRKSVRRRRWPLLAAATLVVIGGTAATWALLREPTHAASFGCVTDDVTAVMPNDGSSPVDTCKLLWERGDMVAGVTEAPPLVSCVSPNGPVVVVQRTTARTCEDDGMAPWTEEREYMAVGRAVTNVRIAFHDRFRQTGERCATAGEWTSRLAEALRKEDAGEWGMRVDQIEPDRHCYDVAEIDPTKRTIRIIGMPGDDSIGCDPRTGC